MREPVHINRDYPGNWRRPRWLAMLVTAIVVAIIAFTGNRFRDALTDSPQEAVPEVCDITNQSNEPVEVYPFPFEEDYVIDTMQPNETRMVLSSSRLFYQVETADGEKGLVRKDDVKLNGLCRSKR